MHHFATAFKGFAKALVRFLKVFPPPSDQSMVKGYIRLREWRQKTDIDLLENLLSLVRKIVPLHQTNCVIEQLRGVIWNQHIHLFRVLECLIKIPSSIINRHTLRNVEKLRQLL